MEMITKSIINQAVLMICALVLILSLAACGAKNNTEETTAPTEAAATASTTEAEAPAATDAAVIGTEAQASADTGLVGSWDYAELSGIVYTFNADGTGTYDMFGEVMDFTYEADGSVLKIMYIDADVDAPMELEYEIDGDTLNIKDSFGNDTVYKRK
ncbi:MAG: hypothetical protein IJG87_09315 [Ruminococcus sp.]|nr:hypothetical protein [Ruminococcus sp.]